MFRQERKNQKRKEKSRMEQEQKDSALRKWFGERKPVRLMLLAALLTLCVIHVDRLILAVLFLWKVASPLIVGAAMAYILEIVVKRLEKVIFPKTQKKWLANGRRILCILLAFVLILTVVVFFFITVLPGLGDALTLLTKELPAYFEQLKEWTLKTFADVPSVVEYVTNLKLDWPSIQEKIVDWAVNGLGGGGLLSSTVSVISAVTGRVANFLISLIFAIFLLCAKNTLQKQFSRILRACFRPRKQIVISHVLETMNRSFSGFIVGQVISAMILGFTTWMGMRIFNMPIALMVGVITGVTALIPIIGGYIGAALGTFLVFTANPGMALWFLLFIVTLQTLTGNLLYPKLVGSSVGLPSLWVLAAVSVGGGIGGIGGMIAAVPLTATGYALFREWVAKREKEKAASASSSVSEGGK